MLAITGAFVGGDDEADNVGIIEESRARIQAKLTHIDLFDLMAYTKSITSSKRLEI